MLPAKVIRSMFSICSARLEKLGTRGFLEQSVISVSSFSKTSSRSFSSMCCFPCGRHLLKNRRRQNRRLRQVLDIPGLHARRCKQLLPVFLHHLLHGVDALG